jgi:hypothetical protein
MLNLPEDFPFNAGLTGCLHLMPAFDRLITGYAGLP